MAASIVAAAMVLAGCSAAANPVPPEQQVARALDNFAADNTGSYTLTVDFGPTSMSEQGTYRVSPDAGTTMRTFSSRTRDTVVRYLRDGPGVWLELPSDDGDPTTRSDCWLHGTAAQIQAVEGAYTGAVQLATPAVEVVLGLERGRMEGDRYVADANRKTVAAALGFAQARRLGVDSSRVDVPVTLTIADARVTSSEVDLADLGDVELPGTITATFGDPGATLDLTPPGDVVTAEATAGQRSLDALPRRCQ